MKGTSVVVGVIGLLLLAGSAFACEVIPPKEESAGMTGEEFDNFVNAANEELEEKQDQLGEKHGLGSFARWHFNQETSLLQFFDKKDRLAVEADVIDIGSYSPKSNTWKWAWSNESVLPPLREKSARLKELEGVTGIALFSQEAAFEVEDEAMAWELAAIAVKHLGAIGVYRVPSSSGGPHGFLAITSIRKMQEPAN